MINKNLIKSGDKILCCVSGGADSIAMLYDLYTQKNLLNIELFACHLNHKTRNGESDRDMNFVIDFCKKLNIKLLVEEKEVKNLKNQGFEASARNIRYDFFQKAKIHFGANKIATAHNAQDNLETILLNITRGTGLQGLCGIPEIRQDIIRPILKITRDKIIDYLLKNNIQYIIDSSNNTDDYSRNKIRHHAIKTLLEINPKAVENTTKMSCILKNDNDFLNDLAQKEDTRKFITNGFYYNICDIKNLHTSLSYRVLNHSLKDFSINLSFENFTKIIDLCNSNNPSAKLNLYNNIEIFRKYDTINFRNINDTAEILNLSIFENEIIIETNKLENLNISYSLDCDFIDIDSIYISKKETNDRFNYKIGSKSLKKAFIDKKIPQNIREFIPILRDKNGIISICYLGIDYKRQTNKNKKMKITFRSI